MARRQQLFVLTMVVFGYQLAREKRLGACGTT